MKSLRHGSRALVVVVLALFAAAQLQSALHRSLVPHEICSIHGELAHGRTHLHDPAGLSGDHGPTFEGPEARGEHAEHCTDVLLGRTKKLDLHVGPRLTLVGASSLAPCRLHAVAPEPSRVALHLLAPKNSPPATV